MATSYDALIADLQKQREEANLANQKRLDEMRKISDQVIQNYSPGGSYEQSQLAQLNTRKKQDVASGMQSLVRSGMANTTVAAGLPSAWEQQVGTPSRLGLEDILTQRRTEAQQAKLGMLERVEDVGPDSNLIAQLAEGAGQTPNYMPQHYGASSFSRPNTYVRGVETAPSQYELNKQAKQQEKEKDTKSSASTRLSINQMAAAYSGAGPVTEKGANQYWKRPVESKIPKVSQPLEELVSGNYQTPTLQGMLAQLSPSSSKKQTMGPTIKKSNNYRLWDTAMMSF